MANLVEKLATAAGCPEIKTIREGKIIEKVEAKYFQNISGSR